jgi:predicted RNA binding protein YcfA (HicA-like mRNA interferase family)
MPKLPRWNAAEAEAELIKAGFQWLRSKGSHRIYARGWQRVVIPFHGNQALHPKIVKPVIDALDLPGH